MAFDDGFTVVEKPANQSSDEQRNEVLRQYGEQITDIKHRIALEQAILASLDQQIAERKEELNKQLSMTITALSSEVADLKKLVNDLRDRVVFLNVEIEHKTSERDAISLDFSKEIEQIASRKAELDTLIVEAEAQQNTLNDTFTKTQNALADLEARQKAFEENKAKALSAIEASKKDLQEKTELVDSRTAKLNELISQNEAILVSLGQKEAAAKLLIEEANQAHDVLHQVKAERDLLLSDKENIKQALSKIESDTAQLKAWREVLVKKEQELKNWENNLKAVK